MTDKRTQAGDDTGNMEKDPADWVTGDEPMTGAQKSYLKTLSEQAHVDFDENLTKADASRRIDELQQQTGRGREGQGAPTSGNGPRRGDDREKARATGAGTSRHDGDRDSANPGSAGTSGDEATLSIGPG